MFYTLLMNKLALVIAILALGVAGTMSLTIKKEPVAGGFNPTGGNTYTLQSSISSSQTSITLTSFTEPVSNIPYTMSYLNSDIEYGTIAPSSGSSEFVSFTGITQNSNGTATLTGVTRGLARTPGNTGCVASTTLARAYPGQSQFILGNSPCFYSEYATKRNDQVITGQWRFDQYPTASSTVGFATTSWQFITYGQAAAIAAQGAATSTESIAGITRLGTALQAASSTYLGVLDPLVLQTKNATDTPIRGCATGYTSTAGAGCSVIAQLTGKISQAWLNLTEAFTVTGAWIFSSTVTHTGQTTFSATSTAATSTQPTGFKGIFSLVSGMSITLSSNAPLAVTLATSTGRVFLVDGDVATTTDFYGFAVSSATPGNAIQVQTTGVVTGFTGLTAGSRYYAQDTAGTIGTSVGTSEVYVGTAISATEIALDPLDSAHSWQYLGSQSISSNADTVINQPLARFAVLKLITSGNDCTIGTTITIAKVGVTTGSIQEYGSEAGGGALCSSNYTWTSTSSIRTTIGGTAPVLSATAYYYR